MTASEKNLCSALVMFFGPQIRVRRGQMPLGTVFWAYGAAVSSTIAVLFATAFDRGEVALLQALVGLSALYTIWIVVGIWRCSPNAAPFWGNLARWLKVAWALNSGFVLVFLQLDLLVRHVQG